MKQESGKQESGRFSQQAINRIAEVAIARQLRQDVEVRVDMTATLKQLAKGQIDAMTILIQGLILAGNLKTEEYQLDIGAVTVKPLSAVKGRIQLLHPSQGKLRVVISAADLTAALNQTVNGDRAKPDTALPRSQSNQAITNQAIIRCEIADRALRLSSTDAAAASESIVLTPVPQSEAQTAGKIEGKTAGKTESIDWQSASGSAVIPPDWLTGLNQLLNLKEFERKGLFLSIRDIQLPDGKLQILADALIQSFPPE